jgi:hypothetical protein
MRGILAGLSAVALALPSPGRSESAPPDPGSVHMAGTINFEGGGDYSALSLHTCALRDDFIVCDFVLTSHRTDAFDYKFGGPNWASKLVDNFKIDHPQVRGYFLDGRGQHQDTITLTKNDWVWAVIEYGAAASDIQSARVIFSGGRYFSTPVESAGGHASR